MPLTLPPPRSQPHATRCRSRHICHEPTVVAVALTPHDEAPGAGSLCLAPLDRPSQLSPPDHAKRPARRGFAGASFVLPPARRSKADIRRSSPPHDGSLDAHARPVEDDLHVREAHGFVHVGDPRTARDHRHRTERNQGLEIAADDVDQIGS